MAARQRPSVVKSQALIIRLAENRNAMVHEYIARTRHRIELSWAKLPISRVLSRVTRRRLASYVKGKEPFLMAVSEGLVSIPNMADTMPRPIKETTV